MSAFANGNQHCGEENTCDGEENTCDGVDCVIDWFAPNSPNYVEIITRRYGGDVITFPHMMNEVELNIGHGIYHPFAQPNLVREATIYRYLNALEESVIHDRNLRNDLTQRNLELTQRNLEITTGAFIIFFVIVCIGYLIMKRHVVRRVEESDRRAEESDRRAEESDRRARRNRATASAAIAAIAAATAEHHRINAEMIGLEGQLIARDAAEDARARLHEGNFPQGGGNKKDDSNEYSNLYSDGVKHYLLEKKKYIKEMYNEDIIEVVNIIADMIKKNKKLKTFGDFIVKIRKEIKNKNNIYLKIFGDGDQKNGGKKSKKREQKEKREQREKRKQRGKPVKKQKEVEEGNDELINHKSLCTYKKIFFPNDKWVYNYY